MFHETKVILTTEEESFAKETGSVVDTEIKVNINYYFIEMHKFTQYASANKT